VRGGRAPVAGHTHLIPCNENGITALHSGPKGLDQQVWDVARHDTDAVHLTCTLADGVGGLPGTRIFDVIYAVADQTLTLDIRARTDAPTPINVAHHPYWRLGDARDHLLQVYADHYLPVDSANIPTGEIAPLAGTPYDHQSPKQLDAQIDHCLCLRRARVSLPQPVAMLTGSNGLSLRIDSTEPGVQVYSGAHLPRLPGTVIAPLAGVALEPQGWPDAVNQPHFPNVICTPDAPYHQITRYLIDAAT